MKNEKLMKAIKNYDMDDLYTFLDEKVQPIYKENLKEGGFSGWSHNIYFDEDGKFSITGAMSVGTSTMDAWEGREVYVGRIPTNPELEIEGLIEYQATEEEKKKIIETLKNDYEYEIDEDLDEEDNDEENLREKGEEYFIKLFPKRYEEIQQIFIDDMWNYKRDELIDNIIYKLNEEYNYTNDYE